MNKHFLVGLLVAVAAVGTAGAQTFRAPVSGRPEQVQRPPAPLPTRRSIGAFPRVRSNPVQLVNPRAPQRYYGPPDETVAPDDLNPGMQRNRGESVNRYTGVILFGFRW